MRGRVEDSPVAGQGVEGGEVVAVQVSVVGSGAEHEERAEEVGRLLAERGCTLVCGGLGEGMSAAARGAKAAGGAAGGVPPGGTRSGAHERIGPVVVTGIGDAREPARVARR